MNNKKTLNQRSIRIFISSTFLDMQAERDELIKKTFPKLRQLFEPQGINITEIDFRWGITKKEGEKGEVLPICFEEIDKCHPYFIGIIGNRYGTPLIECSDNPPEFYLSKIPWFTHDHLQRSITELEIIYGALNYHHHEAGTFFYFLEPENSSTNENNSNGLSKDQHKEELICLKERIKQKGFIPRKYSNSEQLGNLVYEDFRLLIEKLFPWNSVANPFERENLNHQLFVENHSMGYLAHHFYFDHIEDYINSNCTLPLVLVGETGSGKSSLLASWVMYRKNIASSQLNFFSSFKDSSMHFFKRLFTHPARNTANITEIIITHFVGASTESTNWIEMLKRIILNFFKEAKENDSPIPEQPEKLLATFLNWIQSVSGKIKIILVIDGLDKLKDKEQALNLLWLPEKIPENIRLILSTNSGPSYEEICRRQWLIFSIKPFSSCECKHFISTYLKPYRKSLEADQINKIIKSRQAKNPLFLKIILDELRIFGIYEELSKKITNYISSDSLNSLCDKVLKRLEEDFEKERKGLVEDSMKFLWGARQGLTEEELLILLGGYGNRFLLSSLFLALKEFLVNKSGVISFQHDSFLHAVENRYLTDPGEKYRVHRCLADLFSMQDITPRKIEELPWHLAAIQSWKELFSLLSDTGFLKKAWERHRWEVKSYWALLEKNTKFTMADAYREVINTPMKHRDCAWQVCFLLVDTAHKKEALILAHFLEQDAREEKNYDHLQASLSLQATLLKDRGEFDRALILLEEQEKICREEQEKICRQSSNRQALAASLGNQGVIYLEKSNFDKAMHYFKEEAEICLEIGDHVGLSMNKGNQGAIYLERKQNTEAMKLFNEQEKLCRQNGDISGLQKSLWHQGIIIAKNGESQKALKLYKDAEKISRQLGDNDSLQEILGYQALIQQESGDYDQAANLLDEKEKICREIDDPDSLIKALIEKYQLYAHYLKATDYAQKFIVEALQIAQKNKLDEIIHKIGKFLNNNEE